jgi:signal transduction histidine kinase
MLCNEDYGSLNEKQKKFVNNILLSGEHLLRLVNDILDLSKIESGSIIITPETFEVYPKIKETVSILKGLAIRKNIDISMDIDEELYIKADLKMFRQIMYNLLSNAIKFSDENGQIMVTAFRQGNIVKFEVQDNGIGIPKKDQDKIFKSFAQLDSSLTRRQEGTGLGLTLTKKFVEFHKGEIDFESEENRGSKFWFTLPQ